MYRQDHDALDLAIRCRDLGSADGAPAAANSEWPEADQARVLWAGLVSRILKGDQAAADAFVESYSRGAKLLFKRHLSPIKLDDLVRESLDGAVEEIRRGWIREPRDLVHFLRGILARHKGMEPLGESPDAPGAAVHLGANDRMRVRLKAKSVTAALAGFNARERSLLDRYYLDGQPVAVIVEETGVSLAEFTRLRQRLMESSERAELRKQPSRVEPRIRKASAAGD